MFSTFPPFLVFFFLTRDPSDEASFGKRMKIFWRCDFILDSISRFENLNSLSIKLPNRKTYHVSRFA